MSDKKHKSSPDQCPPSARPGPVREAGGTTGAGNLSPNSANRTGGATGGVTSPETPQKADTKKVPPSPDVCK